MGWYAILSPNIAIILPWSGQKVYINLCKRQPILTSHHIEETDAGLDRPLYPRNKMYTKNLKTL